MTTLPYATPVRTVEGDTKTLEALKDSALLIVNVASKCGMTPQYAQLEALQQKYGERGLQVLGFPCNQFAGQEPGTDEQIAQFCATTYGVTFPIFSKIRVNGLFAHPLYRALTHAEDANGRAGRVGWNFEKFLVAPGGRVVGRYRSKMKPDDPAIVFAIESVLPS